jgi:hypothetical protein
MHPRMRAVAWSLADATASPPLTTRLGPGLGGGKFANGAITAAYGYIFNYLQNHGGTTTSTRTPGSGRFWLFDRIFGWALDTIIENTEEAMPKTVYRVYDNVKAMEFGSWWSPEDPTTYADWRNSLAVYPAWNKGTYYVEATVTYADFVNGRIEPGPGPNSTAEPQIYRADLGGGPYDGGAVEWQIRNAQSVVKNPIEHFFRPAGGIGPPM